MDYYNERDYLIEDKLEPNEYSDIADFFDGTSVLITGVTGFIGNLLLEKLLRCCPGIKLIFILMRAKKGKHERERLNELLKSEIYFQLWKKNPDFAKKIVLISGDCSLPQLGLSIKDREKLLDTNIVFHAAASLQFDEHLHNSFNTNVSGTKYLLELTKEMKNVKVFTYVSTAYSHVNEKKLGEEFKEPRFTYKQLKVVVDNCSDEQMTGLMQLLQGEGNTYSLMKSVTEDVVKDYKDFFPVCVTRPSIVVNTFVEPLTCWINGINGPSGVILCAILGLMHSIPMNANYIIDLIPADKVVSAIIASTWDAASKRPSHAVYNVVSWKRNPLTWAKLTQHLSTAGHDLKLASDFLISEPFYLYTDNNLVHFINSFFLHLVPGVLIDWIIKIKGGKPMLMKVFRKASYMLNLMSVYVTCEWFFEDSNLYSVWKEMSPSDKIKFNFSMENFSWRDYLYFFSQGIQIYILKESRDIESISKSRWKRKWLQIFFYCEVIISCLVMMWLLYSNSIIGYILIVWIIYAYVNVN